MRRLAAEWEEQAAILLTWPHENHEWFPSLKIVNEVFINLTYHISKKEFVIITVPNTQLKEKIELDLLKKDVDLKKISFFILNTYDIWARDHGPIIIEENEKSKILNFTFNAWGKKYPDKIDNAITKELMKQKAFGNILYEESDFILEGGSIESDGDGTLLTTKSCLLNVNRNRHYSKENIEQFLKEILGCQRILFLSSGNLIGDDTDGHIDILARFGSKSTIFYVQCKDKNDPHYQTLNTMENELKQFKQSNGKPYELIPLPLPKAKFDLSGNRMPATYANFLMINEGIILPVYDDPADEEAFSLLKNFFKNREIIPINALPLIAHHGSIHCVCMQIPKKVYNKGLIP